METIATANLTAAHYAFALGAAAVFLCMVLKKRPYMVCAIFCFVTGLCAFGPEGGAKLLLGGLLFAAFKLGGLLIAVSIACALAACLMERVAPVNTGGRGSGSFRLWGLGLGAAFLSVLIWPYAIIPLAAVLFPARKSGLKPVGAAVIAAFMGFGAALSLDPLFQAVPSLTALFSGVSAGDVNGHVLPLALIMAAAASGALFLLNRNHFKNDAASPAEEVPAPAPPAARRGLWDSWAAWLRHGFGMGIRALAPLLAVFAFFSLGGTAFYGFIGLEAPGGGILNDWAAWLVVRADIQAYPAAFVQLAACAAAGMGGGLGALPFAGALAAVSGGANVASTAVLAALGQLGVIWGAVLSPRVLDISAEAWGADPGEMKRLGRLPILIGFTAALLAAFLML